MFINFYDSSEKLIGKIRRDNIDIVYIISPSSDFYNIKIEGKYYLIKKVDFDFNISSVDVINEVYNND